MVNWSFGRGSATTALGMFGAVAVGFWLGRGPESAAQAAPPPANPPAPAPAVPQSDWDKRVVAYIYGSIPITREDLGEYLIARHGLDNIELLVNKKIIDHACELRKIEITDAEVEASILADCASINVNRAQFVQNVLKKYGKTLYEWKEDVVKPRLLLTKLCQGSITVTDEDMHKAFDAEYGEKRDVRIIIWPKTEEKIALQEYESVRKDDPGFDHKARSQATSYLAATGGRIKPISRNSGVHESVEKAAFSLQPGEVSSLIQTPEGILVLKMDKVIPPDATVKFEEKREALQKDVYDRKVAAAIPPLFKRLKEEAKPVFILKKPDDPVAEEREAEQAIKQTGTLGPTQRRP
jgi:hypothetical protein